MFNSCSFLWMNHDLLSERFSWNCAVLKNQTNHLPASLSPLPPFLLPLLSSSFLPFLRSFLLSSHLSPFLFLSIFPWNAHVHKQDGCLILWINWQCWSTAVCRPHLSSKAARHTFKLKSQRLQHLDCSTNWYDQPDPATIDLHSFCHPGNWNLL